MCAEDMGNTALLWKKRVMVRFNEGRLKQDSVIKGQIRKKKRLESHENINSSPGVRHDVSESSSLQELHDDPQLVSHQVAVVHLHHVLMVIVSHDHHLQLRRKQTGYSYFTH